MSRPPTSDDVRVRPTHTGGEPLVSRPVAPGKVRARPTYTGGEPLVRPARRK